MLFYELYTDFSLMGNIEVKVFDDSGFEIESRKYFETADFKDCDLFSRLRTFSDFDDNEVEGIYAEKDSSGNVWLVVVLLEKSCEVC